MGICISTTLLVEGKLMLFAFFIAVVVLSLVSMINKKYIVNGKTILFLGDISYFFYLLHARVCYTLIVYTGINSIIAWVGITLIISWLVFFIYNKVCCVK